MEQLIKLVEEWAREKEILTKATPEAQWGKMIEEVDELLEAYMEDFEENEKLELGDVLVTVIVYAKLREFDVKECLQKAYNKISKRKGKMINGAFVKEGDY